MADPNARDAKLIQYLNEAYGKEKELETSLEAHIGMTTRTPYKKRLQDHLKETKRHAREVERRIKKLGGTAETVSVPGPDAVTGAAQTAQNLLNRGAAAAKGVGHMVRGTGEAEKMLKNAKTEYFNEAEEIATYTSIETLAEAVGDKETAQLAKAIRREEERMRGFLEKLIPQLTKAVATDEIPAPLRRTATRRRSSTRRASSSRSTGTRRASSSRSGGSRSTSRSTTKRSGTSRSSGTRRASSSGTRRASSSGTRRASSSRSTGTRSASSRSGGSRSTGRSTTKRSGTSGSRSTGARSGSSRASSSRSSSGGSSSRRSTGSSRGRTGGRRASGGSSSGRSSR